jgi:ComF family protein
MSLLDFLFPKICYGCGAWGEYVCADCLNKILVKDRQKCPACEKDSVFGKTHYRCQTNMAMDGLSIGLSYTGLLRTLLSRYKFSLVSDLTDTLVELWVSLPDMQAVFSREPLVITSVPLSKVRFRERGFNQAELLARKLAMYLHWEYRELLEKDANTQKQSTLPRNERATNIEGVFRVVGAKKELAPRVLLVDDIWTTGATMRECTRTLKKAGVEFVWGATIAG